MTSRRDISDEDSALFRSALGNVRELPTSDRVQDPARRPAARPRKRTAQSVGSDHQMPDGVLDDAPGFADRQEFCRSSVPARTWRRLRKGQLPVEEELDLHGFRVDAARLALAGFLAECEQQDRRCVRVVTGKGFGSRSTRPVLKAQVDRWLRLRDEVLAFCSTTARDGGTGAVYVLLRHSPRGR